MANSNIALGACRVYVVLDGSAISTNPISITSSFIDVGYTTAGANAEIQVTTDRKRYDSFGSVITRKRRNDVTATITATILDMSAANIALLSNLVHRGNGDQETKIAICFSPIDARLSNILFFNNSLTEMNFTGKSDSEAQMALTFQAELDNYGNLYRMDAK